MTSGKDRRFSYRLHNFILYSLLTERLDAVEEMIQVESPRARETIHKLRECLKKLPDLAKGLCRIQYGKVKEKGLQNPFTLTHFCKVFPKGVGPNA